MGRLVWTNRISEQNIPKQERARFRKGGAARVVLQGWCCKGGAARVLRGCGKGAATELLIFVDLFIYE